MPLKWHGEATLAPPFWTWFAKQRTASNRSFFTSCSWLTWNADERRESTLRARNICGRIRTFHRRLKASTFITATRPSHQKVAVKKTPPPRPVHRWGHWSIISNSSSSSAQAQWAKCGKPGIHACDEPWPSNSHAPIYFQKVSCDGSFAKVRLLAS